MNARQVLQQHVTWQLGNGSVCGAFGQPWHSFWTQVNPSSSRQRPLSVSHFLNPSGQWDCGKLIEEFGFAIALFISMSITSPLLGKTRADRLIFTYARNGQFTLKKAYHLVAPEVALPNFPPDLLRLIWHTKGLLPRIRLFLWKVLHNGLPLGDLIGRRVSNISRPCSLCGFHAETIQHALFKCPWAQSLWFASSLGLHTDDLPENISELLKTVLGSEGEDIARIVANHLWALWKLRCIEVFQGKNATPQSFMALATSYSKLTVDAGLASCRAVGPTPQNCSQVLLRA
ncbi:Ribonuclease H-like superfamily protein [Rhynchospora pubera]|uniref:Ribonuclease H-like superfamily protein n=1 Tax=Rhynchospora pubera TaxID=906938 RepID=A0AAV8DG58_9POAL|nr:Ribonuclease H-like superfamily protein [Rhynchospora pubera]